MPIAHKEIDDDFDNFVDGRISGLEDSIVRVLESIGEYGYELAVARGNYSDRTGTLRSSIGYGVVKYGRLEKVGGFKNFRASNDGALIGRDKLNELASECGASEITLILVAGAEYAQYVEAMGRDVISFSEIECFRKAEDMIDNLLK